MRGIAPYYSDNSAAWRALRDGHAQELPLILNMYYVLSLIPVSTAHVERGFSYHRILKTRLRNKLSVPVMDALMRIQLFALKSAVARGTPGWYESFSTFYTNIRRSDLMMTATRALTEIEGDRAAGHHTRKMHNAVAQYSDADWVGDVDILDTDIHLVSSDGEHDADLSDTDSEADYRPPAAATSAGNQALGCVPVLVRTRRAAAAGAAQAFAAERANAAALGEHA
jgi:hypothetical protein